MKRYGDKSSTAASRQGYTFARRRNADGTTKDEYFKPYVNQYRQRKVKGAKGNVQRSKIAHDAFMGNPERMSDVGLNMMRGGKVKRGKALGKPSQRGVDLIHKAGVLADSYNRARGRLGKGAGYERVARVVRRKDGVKQTYWVIAKTRRKSK